MEDQDAESILLSLLDKFFLKFDHIDTEALFFREIESEKAPAIAIYGVGSPKIASLFDINFVKERYLIETNTLEWDSASLEQKQWLMLEILCSIGSKCDGKINKTNFNSYDTIVGLIVDQKLSHNYIDDLNLPNLLSPEIEIF